MTPGSEGEESTHAFMGRQVTHFFDTALETLGNHQARWLLTLVDCAIAYPVKEVALAITGILLVVYDGGDYGVALLAIDAATIVTVEGEMMNLRALVFEVTQFITEVELHENSVLFQDPQNVDDIRAWAANGGEFFGPGGARLERKMKTLILGRPIHSHLSERTVGLGNGLVKKFGKHELEDRISGKLQEVANGLRMDARVAACEYEARARSSTESQAARAPETHWRDAATGLVREHRGVHLRHRNKEVVKLQVLAFMRRAALVTPEVAKAALDAQRDIKTQGLGHEARVKRRAVDRVAKANASVAKRQANGNMKNYDEAFVAAGAAACDPPRMHFGKLDLLKPQAKEVLALECEERDLQVKRSGPNTAKPNEPSELVAFLVQRLRDYHGGETLIPKLTSFEAGKKGKKWAVREAESDDSSTRSSGQGSGRGPLGFTV